MSKIINDRHSVDRSPHFEPALHALESLESSRDFFGPDVTTRSQRSRRSSIPHVVFAGEGKFKTRPRLAMVQNRPTGARGLDPQIGDSPSRLQTRAISLNRTECPGQATVDALSPIEADDPSAFGNKINQSLKGRFYCVEIFVDVGMVELDRSKDDGVRKIVQELRTFVEERCVIFVSLKNEVSALSQLKATAEVLRDAADEKRWLQSGRVENPG